MALIDIACVHGHQHEVYRAAADWPATPACPTCGGSTHQYHPPPRVRATPDPVIVYKAPDGSFRFPGDTSGIATGKYDRAGFERIELRNHADVRRFENVMNKRELIRAQRRVERQHQGREQRESHTHSELRRRMPTMTSYGRALAEAAIRRTNSAPREYAKESGFHVDCYSNDRTNRMESRGPDGRRRRD